MVTTKKNSPGVKLKPPVLSPRDKKKRIGLIKEKNREWGLKHDVKRAVIYESMDDGAVINTTGLVSPSEAIMLSLFDGKRTTGEVIRLCSDLFDESLEKAETNIAQLVKKWDQAMEEKNERSMNHAYNPADFSIPADHVDMKRSRFYQPIGLTFRVSDDCMRDCIYCNVERKHYDESECLSLERWDQLAEEAKQIKIVSLVLSGGDPFMNKHFPEIVEGFTKRGLSPFIATKSLVTKEKAYILKDIGIRSIQISIDAPVPNVVDFLTGSPGSFHQAETSIDNLLEAGIEVTTNTVITAYNVLLIPDLIKFLEAKGITRMRRSQFGRSYYKQVQDDLFVPKRAGLWLENELIRLKKAGEIGESIEFTFQEDESFREPSEKEERYYNRAVCSGGRWGCIITSNGKVIPCDEIPAAPEYIAGDVTHRSVMDVWNSNGFDKYLNPDREPFRGTVCYTCEIFEECHQKQGRCYRDALKAFGSIYEPSPSCWKAPKGIRLT